ncbi:uncharacterized protein At5g41620-like [Hibiscus syriacus]|uniref:uncharacterized protein At5g41620-like n=1 Tax=Hibiscus syriacus TaxID=106335 RepID=UPI001924043A|nr:uncharacterized protein At5g41620-like [Hibiscus syriacus]
MGGKGRGGNLMVGKRAGPSTPSTAWPHFHSSSQNPTHLVSARKLCAHFWRLQPPHYSVSNMPPKLRLQRFKDKAFDADVDHPLHQVAPYKPASTPSNSLGFKETLEGSSGYKVKASMELLKVLKRIWALEDQHVSNVSSVKALKMELDFSLARIQELQFTRHKEQGRIKVVIQSLRDKLENEGKLRKNSEISRRKLARELSEVNSCFVDALKELERERKARILLENLCDEFARGVQCLKHKHVVDDGGKPGRLILHISEAWLDDRTQMKPAGMNSIVDKLSLDIHTLLDAKCEEDSSGDEQRDELNETVKARSQGDGKGSKVIRSVYQGRGSLVQRWVSKLKSGDFETSTYSQKLRKESIQGKITRSKTRRPTIV